jgi:hypothetical protein
MRRLFCVAVLASLLVGLTSRAEASTIDLTTAGATGNFADGAFFAQGAQLSGTGVFPAFVQIAPGGSLTTEQAYNTTVNMSGPLNNNGASDQFNHEILVSALPVLTCTAAISGATGCTVGTNYYSFFLDVNESAGGGDEFLSLDQLQVFTSTTANQSSQPTPSGTLRYNMDAVTNNNILLNFLLEPGSGRADMEFLIPVSAFGAALPTDFVYIFSHFGDLGVVGARNYGASDGFEEWALGRSNAGPPTTVPEPVSLALFGLGLVGVAHRSRRTRK